MITFDLVLSEDPAQTICYIMEQFRNGFYPTCQYEKKNFCWERQDTRTVIWLTPKVTKKADKMLNEIGQPYVIEENRRVETVLSLLADEKIKHNPWVHGEVAEVYRRLATTKYLRTFEAVGPTGFAGAVLGIELPQVFLAETMVTLQPNGSKAALCSLVKHYAARRFQLIDVQSSHKPDHPSARLFEETIDTATYLDLLKRSYVESVSMSN